MKQFSNFENNEKERKEIIFIYTIDICYNILGWSIIMNNKLMPISLS